MITKQKADILDPSALSKVNSEGAREKAGRPRESGDPTDSRVRGNDTTFDVRALHAQFPILRRTMRGHPLVFLDNASTTQKPERVIDAEKRFSETMNANIHRGVYELSEQATAAYVDAHESVARFIGAASAKEIIFVRNATEGINLVVWTWGLANLKAGDRILLTAMEHHSNIVPWQRLARRTGARIEWVELTPHGLLDLDDLERKLTSQGHSEQKRRVSLLSLAHMSNVLGTVNPVREIVERAHAHGVRVILDAAQSVPRMPVDARELDVDFLVFSGHKMYGPTGTGVVYGKRELLETMEPFLTGGDMVKTVTREGATWNDLPWKFEAGTPNIAGGVALGEAARFLTELGMENVWAHEQALAEYALPKLRAVPGLRLIGPISPIGPIRPMGPSGGWAKAGIFSFTLDGIHSHDLASFLDTRGIAIRGGHHCAQPLLASLGLTECARASVGLYTMAEEIDRLVSALEEARRAFV